MTGRIYDPQKSLEFGAMFFGPEPPEDNKWYIYRKNLAHFVAPTKKGLHEIAIRYCHLDLADLRRGEGDFKRVFFWNGEKGENNEV